MDEQEWDMDSEGINRAAAAHHEKIAKINSATQIVTVITGCEATGRDIDPEMQSLRILAGRFLREVFTERR